MTWELRGRDGRVLGTGFTTGGSMEPAAFVIEVVFDVTTDELGSLEVMEPDESDGEGFPVVRVVLPLVLAAGG